MVSPTSISEFSAQRGFSQYLETSAVTGDGCDALREATIDGIDWEGVPHTSSRRIFKSLKDEIIRMRDEGIVLLRMAELKQQLELRIPEERFSPDELRAVVGLLAGPGNVWKLEFGDFVLLHPQRINAYAAAVIRSVRKNTDDIGSIAEGRVLAGDLDYGDMKRLPGSEEEIVLRAMHQAFVDHGLCLREETEAGTQLVFPSYFKRELPEDPGHPPTLVSYRFNGHLDELYSTLIVRLFHTQAFENDKLWRFAADFKSPAGLRLGLKMDKHGEGAATIKVYCDPKIPSDTKVAFVKSIHEHLLLKGQDVIRLRHFVCDQCHHPVRDSELAHDLLSEKGKSASIFCQKCREEVPLWDLLESKFASDAFKQRVRELEQSVSAAIDNESRELILEGHARAITGEAGQIYHGLTNSDHGIDGEIEFKDWSGDASGKRMYMQLKSGDSYLRKRKDGTEVFQIKKPRWAKYWQQQAYPVMLVIRTSDGTIRWMDVSKYIVEYTERHETLPKQVVFCGEPFTASNLLSLRERHLPRDEDRSSRLAGRAR